MLGLFSTGEPHFGKDQNVRKKEHEKTRPRSRRERWNLKQKQTNGKFSREEGNKNEKRWKNEFNKKICPWKVQQVLQSNNRC